MPAFTTFHHADGKPVFFRTDKGEIVSRGFRFNISAGLAFEREEGCSVSVLLQRGQRLTALVAALYHGFKWEARKITKAAIEGDLENFINGDGDIARLFDQLVQALNDSGTFGKNDAKVGDESTTGDDAPAADPLAPTPPTSE